MDKSLISLTDMIKRLGPIPPGMKEVDAISVKFPDQGFIKVVKVVDGVPVYFDFRRNRDHSGGGPDLEKIVDYFRPAKKLTGKDLAIKTVYNRMNAVLSRTDGRPDWDEHDRLASKIEKIMKVVKKNGKKDKKV